MDRLAVTGVGVVSAIGQGKEEFLSALLNGDSNFHVMRRPGRQHSSNFIGAEIEDFRLLAPISSTSIRDTSPSVLAALLVLQEVWSEAKLASVEPERIGLVVGGSNFQQRMQADLRDKYSANRQFVRPTYGVSFMDSDVCGYCTEEFGIRGIAYTVGGASASGQLAVIQAAQAVLSNQVDICVAVGAMMDLSYWECQALRNLGAMGSDRYANEPTLACRPFDKNRDGFIFGENCAAVVIERAELSERRRVDSYAFLAGWGITTDGNRNPNPSLEGEVRSIQTALRAANLTSSMIDYINPHGTGSVLGDEVELAALRECGLHQAYINATKSILGHGLSAAGTVEVAATLLQMQSGKLHPSRNLETPVDPTFQWVTSAAIDHKVQHALTLSVGFGGINTALCWDRE